VGGAVSARLFGCKVLLQLTSTIIEIYRMLRAFYIWFTRKCLNCRDAARLVSESCERELTLFERLKLKMLCFMCPYTARYEEQVSLLHKRVAECDEELSLLADAELSQECRERLKARLEGASRDGSGA